MARAIQQTEADYLADPDDEVKVRKFVAALEQTEDPKHENTAIEVLERTYEKVRKFSLRQKAGQLRLKQLERMRRAMAADVQKNPGDEELKRDYQKFVKDKAEQELSEFRLWSDNYPTDTSIRFNIAQRLFHLGRYDEAIPVLQQVRSDPKYRIDASVFLGRAFLESQFMEEAIDTLKAVIEEYPIQDDDKAKNMHYWLGRALEHQGETAQAIKEYSRVAQVEFTYRDVQQRIRKLRQRDLPPGNAPSPAPSPVGSPGGGSANP
jgi:tetratricopeptide (TPR) repeat protein